MRLIYYKMQIIGPALKNNLTLGYQNLQCMNRILFFISLLTFSLCSFSQWNPNTSVNLQVGDSDASDLQTATTADGKTWIAFYAVNSTTGNYDMRAQLLDVQGNKLLGSDGALVSDQISGSATFAFNVCVDNSGSLIIAFQYEVTGVLNAVVTKINQDGSLPWGAGTVLGPGLAPYAAVNTAGEVFVAWNNNSPSTLYMQKLTSTGVIAWSSPVPVQVGTSNTTRGQIVTHGDGNFTLVFQRRSFGISTTLFARRYNGAGSAVWAAPVQISNLTSSGARYYSILNIGDVTYFGYYVSSGSRFSSYLQKINSNGTLPWGINGSAFSTYSASADPVQQTTGIAYEPGTASVWGVCTYSDPGQTQYGVYVQKFDTATGIVQLDPLGKAVYPISASNDSYQGGLHVYNGGPVFITYNANTDYKIYATRLDASGNFVWPGQRAELSSTTASLGNPKGRYSFAGMVNGQAVAVWTENRGSGSKAYAQNITALGPLPVSLAEFRGLVRGTEALLFWTTESESNNKHFEIERSRDGVNFFKIGTVMTKAPGGNSQLMLSYIYTDKQPLTGENYYRLKQIDLDGRSSYSNVIVLRFDKQTQVNIKSLYPLPATSVLNMALTAEKPEKISVMIADMTGRLIREQQFIINRGDNTIRMDVGFLPAGMYSLRLMLDDKILLSESWMKK